MEIRLGLEHHKLRRHHSRSAPIAPSRRSRMLQSGIQCLGFDEIINTVIVWIIRDWIPAQVHTGMTIRGMDFYSPTTSPPAMPALLGDMIATSRGISPPHFSAFNPLLADCLPIASRRVLFPPSMPLLDKVDIMWQTTQNFSERGATDAYIP